MTCCKCHRENEELRGGFCWDCANTGERAAANRTVRRHLTTMITNLWRRRCWQARYDVTWAWQRLTRTGDYRRGGYFEREGHFK